MALKSNHKPEEKISSFSGEYYFLSNFYPVVISFGGVDFQNSEAIFQAMKCNKPKDRYKFVHLNASEAKRLGRSIELREDWENIKERVMFAACLAKFSQNLDLKDLLIKTYPCILEEGNTWNDTEWGICNGIDSNKLGIILMKIRDILMKEQNPVYKGEEYHVN